MAWLAWDITSGKVQEHAVTRPVKGEVRKYILDELQDATSNGRTLSPPFRSVLDKTERNLDEALEMSYQTLATPRDEQRGLALRYIRFLREKYGTLDPKREVFFSSVESRNFSAISNFTESAFGNLGRRSASGGGGTSPASTLNGSRTHRHIRQPSNPRLSPIQDDVPLGNVRRTRPSSRSTYTQVPQSDTQSINTMPLFPPPARNYGPESGALSPTPTGNSRPAVRPMGGPPYPSVNPYNPYNPVPQQERGTT